MYCLTLNYDPTEWRLFIGSSKLSLKTVLLHKRNCLPSVQIGTEGRKFPLCSKTAFKIISCSSHERDLYKHESSPQLNQLQ